MEAKTAKPGARRTRQRAQTENYEPDQPNTERYWLRSTVDKNPVAGKGLESTASAPKGLHDSPRPEGCSVNREVSRLNTPKADENYRCPQCLHPCWLCNPAKPPARTKSDSWFRNFPEASSGHSCTEPDSYQSEDMSALRSSKRPAKRTRLDSRKYLGPEDEHFEAYILIPAGIEISEEFRDCRPEDLSSGDTHPRTASRVYLTISNATSEEISAQFRTYSQRKYTKATLTKLVSRYIAPFDPYINPWGPEAVKSLWRDKWLPCKTGPEIPPGEYTYDWDIEPEMTYMVAINLFGKDLRRHLQRPDRNWLLAEPCGVCPYLTFALDSEAEPQIAAASALWLYQRKKLRDQLKSSNFSDLRHYSIVISPPNYQIWVATVDGKGYLLQRVAVGSFYKPNDIQQFVKWSNAIHRWGLGLNAKSFKRDVEALWREESHVVVQEHLIT